MVDYCADLCRNHGGSKYHAIGMIDQAHLAGATIVKLQEDDGIGEYHHELITLIHQLGLRAAVTVRTAPIDIRYRGADILKIGSGECLNEKLIRAASADGRPLVISTGGTNYDQFRRIQELAVTAVICECVSSYPNEAEEVRLGFVKAEGVQGYSDHMPSIHMSLAAIALGCTYIEKHVSFDPMRRDYNHSSSISFVQFQNLVRQGNEISSALQNKRKSLLDREVSTGKLMEYRAKYHG